MKCRWLPLSISMRRGVRLDAPARSTLPPCASRISTPLRREHRPVAVFEIADRVGERRQRDRVGAEIHLALAVADRERRAFARADQQIVLAVEQEGEREGAAQLLQRAATASPATCRCFISSRDQMRDDFGVGLGVEIARPSATARSRSSRKFSMMPLCTTATRSVACGCALVSVGRPWVAQRVWPMPIVPASGSLVSRFSRFCSLPSARRRVSAPPRASRRRPNHSRGIRGA